MSASPDNPMASPVPQPLRHGRWRSWWPLVLGLLIGAVSMFFFRGLAQPPVAPSAANSLPADDDPFSSPPGPWATRGNQPTLAAPSAASGQAVDDDDPFAGLPDAVPPATSNSAEPFEPAPAVDLDSLDIKVNPLDDQAAAAARLTCAAETASELRRLTEAQRDALAELATELAAHVGDPPSALFDQLDAEQQLLTVRLAGIELLADRIQAHQDWIARLQTRAAKLTADSRGRRLDRLIVRAFEAQAELTLAKEKHRGERTPEEIAILADEVRHLDKLHHAVSQLYVVGAKGGEAEKWGMTGYHLCRARAELELASGNRAAALVELKKAHEFVENETMNRSVCFGDCFDLEYEFPDIVSRRTASFIRLYEHARLLGDKPLIDWARKWDGG